MEIPGNCHHVERIGAYQKLYFILLTLSFCNMVTEQQKKKLLDNSLSLFLYTVLCKCIPALRACNSFCECKKTQTSMCLKLCVQLLVKYVLYCPLKIIFILSDLKFHSFNWFLMYPIDQIPQPLFVSVNISQCTN